MAQTLPKALRIHCEGCGGLDYRLAGRAVPPNRVTYSCDGCGRIRSLPTELALDWTRASGA